MSTSAVHWDLAKPQLVPYFVNGFVDDAPLLDVNGNIILTGFMDTTSQGDYTGNILGFVSSPNDALLWTDTTSSVTDSSQKKRFTSVTDSDGVIHFIYGANYSTTLYHYTYNGSTFSLLTTYTIPSISYFIKAQLGSDNKIHLVLTDYTNYRVQYAYINSGGSISSFTTVQSGLSTFLTAADICVDDYDHVHLSYGHGYGFSSWIQYATNASGSWVIETINIGGAWCYTSIVVDSEGIVYISRNSGWNSFFVWYYSGLWVRSNIFPYPWHEETIMPLSYSYSWYNDPFYGIASGTTLTRDSEDNIYIVQQASGSVLLPITTGMNYRKRTPGVYGVLGSYTLIKAGSYTNIDFLKNGAFPSVFYPGSEEAGIGIMQYGCAGMFWNSTEGYYYWSTDDLVFADVELEDKPVVFYSRPDEYQPVVFWPRQSILAQVLTSYILVDIDVTSLITHDTFFSYYDIGKTSYLIASGLYSAYASGIITMSQEASVMASGFLTEWDDDTSDQTSPMVSASGNESWPSMDKTTGVTVADSSGVLIQLSYSWVLS